MSDSTWVPSPPRHCPAQTGPEELERFRDEFMPRRRTLVEQVLRRGVERGEVRDGDHEVFIDLWIGFNWHHLLMNKLADESVIPRMVDMLLKGMLRLEQSAEVKCC